MLVQGKKHWGKKLSAIIILVLLVLLSVLNFKIVKDPLLKFTQREISFEDFTGEIQKGYISDNFTYKSDFLNLSGLFARLTGRRTLNNVVKLNNGMLSQPLGDMDMTALANEIISFSDYLDERNTPFFYVQPPFKDPLEGRIYPLGVSSYENKITDDLLSRLSAEEVEALDLRPLLGQTPEMLKQYFFKTDNHWNSDGSFKAFQVILDYLHELLPESNIDLTYTQIDQWERHSIDNWYLGYWGSRVGKFFGGTDPLVWYTPRFETEMSCAILGNGQFFRGDYTKANIRSQHIEEKFNRNYYLHIGGLFPLVQHKNLYAPTPLKVVMIGDSFILPLQAYLSTVFQEVDAVDPRIFSECTIAEYVERTDPDVVILLINPNQFFHDGFKKYGVEEAVSFRGGEGPYMPVVQQDIEVDAKSDNNNFTPCPLDANTIYRVAFSGVDILEGQPEGVGVRLYNKTTNKGLENAIFDLAYCEATNSFDWTFRTPDTSDELELQFYAGIYGSTAGNGVIYRNVTLENRAIAVSDDQ